MRERILVLDGAMGTLIQRHELTEAEFRGERFARPSARPARRRRTLLSLTQPEIIRDDPRRVPRRRRGHHRARTRSTPRAISLADYGLEDRPSEEINAAAAPLARAAADAAEARRTRAPALRRRVARPDEQDRVDLAGRQRPGRAQRHLGQLVDAYRDAARGLRRRRRGHPADRDDLRHAQRQGRDLRRRDRCSTSSASACRSSSAARSSTSRAERCPARPSARSGTACATPGRSRRPQLLARRRDAAASTSQELSRIADVPRRHLPQRRPAQRLRRLRRAAARDDAARARRAGARGRAQPRRRLLRHDARPHRARSSRRSRAVTPRADPRASSPRRASPAWSRSTSAPDSLFVNVGERTNVTGSRAFARLIKEDRVRRGRRDRAPAGRQRRPDDRHQHGRGAARLASRDGALPAT